MSEVRALSAIAILILSLLNVGCGKDPGASVTSQAQPQSQPEQLPGELPSEPVAPTPSPSPTPINTVQTLPVTTIGTQAFQTQAETGNALKLTLKPKPNDNSDYGCVSFKVMIANQVTHTGILRVEGLDSGNCPSAPTSIEMDHSGFLAQGANTVDISIQVEQTDRSCYVMGFQCPSWGPQSTDVIEGELTLETNEAQ